MNDTDIDLALQELVTERLHRHIDQSMQLLEHAGAQLVDAGRLLSHCLLSEGRVFACGEGATALLAQHLSGVLLNRLSRERPGLPAISLDANAGALTAIAGDHGFNEIFARQLRALGQPRDLLVLFAAHGGSGTAPQAVQAAHDRGMPVIALCGETCDDFRALLTADDVELRLPTLRRDEFLELALPVIHGLCELVENQLFGIEE